MTLPLPHPPEQICILRLSAIGDVTHMLPTVHTLRHHWPQAKLTWIIGKAEAALLEGLPGVEFIVFDKSGGYQALVNLYRQLSNRRFDLLLHMQLSFRANVASLAVRAPIRLGFDKARARNFQSLFTNRQIAATTNQHVLDSFLEFPKALGIGEPVLKWDIPIPAQAKAKVTELLPPGERYIVVNPCASVRPRNWRNWNPPSYAAVIDYAASNYGLRAVLTGGKSQLELEYAEAIRAASATDPLDLIGRTSLKELLEVLRRAELVIAPDTGPAHMANAVRTPVIGLYAATNPERAAPYLFRDIAVNRYPDALRRENGKEVGEVRWGTRVRSPEAMDLITVEDVTRRVDELLASLPAKE
jgi:heptosyltransferase I